MPIYKKVTSVSMQPVVDNPGNFPYYVAKFSRAKLQALLDSATANVDIGIFYGTDSMPGAQPPLPADFFVELAILDTNGMPLHPHALSNPKEYLPCPPYCHSTT